MESNFWLYGVFASTNVSRCTGNRGGIWVKAVFWSSMTISVAMLVSSLILSLANRYSGGPLNAGNTWFLDRFTGKSDAL
jgi:hypothetical protein